MEKFDSENKSPESIQEILNERARLEKLLKEKFTKSVAIMFTDIKGSTEFFEKYGDLAGREMINKHNTILFPIIEGRGKIVKTIGDAMMAYFDDPEGAVETAIEMQKALQEYNRTVTKRDEIHIRIGINYGTGIVEEREDGTLDVYGDVVNTAARVEAGGGKKADQILISRSVYEAVRNSEKILCRYYGSIEAKGKAEPLDIYRIVWDPEQEEVLAGTPTRSSGASEVSPGAASEVFISYSSKDREKVMGFAQRLRAVGVSVWIDQRDISGATLWGQEIVEAIEKCKVLLLMASRSSISSPNVVKEVVLASERNKHILPLHLEPIEIPKTLRYPLAGIQHIELFREDQEATLRTVLRSLIRLGVKVEESPETRHKPRPSCTLIVAREENQLRVVAYEIAEYDYKTVQQHETCTVTDVELAALSQNIMNVLAETKAGEKVSKEKLIKLRNAGRSLYDKLLTSEAKRLLHTTQAKDLTLVLDDPLIQIPWELVYDGEQFFCQKFNMGRIISTSQTVLNAKARSVGRPLKMLILANPTGDLPAAHEEGLKILGALEKEDAENDLISARLEESSLKALDILKNLHNFDMVHYAGHADYDDTNPSHSGWLMKDEKLKASSIVEIGKKHVLPSLVFANSCASGRTEEWKVDPRFGERIFGMASAFLLAGVQHYIGTFWEVLDQPSSDFALRFYQELLEGKPVGEAVREARMSLISKYGEETIVWASYVLYGNPSFRYLSPAHEKAGTEKEPVETDPVRGVKDITLPEPALPKVRWKKEKLVPILLGLGVLLGLMAYRFWSPPFIEKKESALYEQAYQELRSHNLEKAQALFEALVDAGKENPGPGYEGLAGVYYEKKDYAKALEFAEKALEKNPESAYALALKGDILLEKGDIDEAVKMYKQAIQFKKGAPWQLAMVRNRLGRTLAAQGSAEEALKQYDQAISLDPSYSEVYSNKGVLLGNLDRVEEAVQVYRRAVELNPKDTLAQVLLKHMQQRQNETTDPERQKRIDALIDDLAQRYRAGKFVSTGSQGEMDPWTSKPMVLALMPFEVKGAISTRAGEEELLTLQLTDLLQETGRVLVVERRILENLLQELKLGSSELADPTTGLKLGRILGARLISTGTITRRAGAGLVNLRLVETETTAIKGALSEKWEREDLLEGAAKALAQKITEKIKKEYPLRGLIALADDESSVVINIGARQGVTSGTIMKMIKEGTPITSAGKILGAEKEDLGLLEITSVEENFSRGKVLKRTQGIEKGMKVEEVAG